MKARIILDSGSQRSYITKPLKDELSLPVKCQETMLIKTFGSQDEKLQICDAVCRGVKLPDGTDMKISAYSVPFICEPLTGQTVALARNMYKHLTEFTLPITQQEQSQQKWTYLLDQINIGIHTYI